MQRLKTAAQVRAAFRSHGLSIRSWCAANGHSYQAVIDLLNGRVRGEFGAAHRAAVALGMKAGKVVEAAEFKPARVAPRPGGHA